MKKLISAALSITLALSLCSCGKRDSYEELTTTNNTANNRTTQHYTQSTNENTESAPAEKTTQIEIEDNSYTLGPEMIIKSSPLANGKSSALEKVSYEVKDRDNSRNLSTKKQCHSHGPASGGQPHYTVVNFQKEFDKYGALTLDTKTKEKALYLTFDCGWEHNNLTSRVLDVLKEKNVPAAFFCTLDHISKQPELIQRMIDEGHIVGNHSAKHPSFAEIDRTHMAKEIEQTENYLRENFGYCAKYFRFPAGEYNENALDLVASLGYMSVFWSVAYNDWNVESVKGKDYAVKTVLSRLHNGAVILLHSVSQDNADALGEIIDSARAQGYTFKALTDYK